MSPPWRRAFKRRKGHDQADDPGRAYVAGRPGDEYRLRLRNRSGGRLLAVVSVDGVNVLTGETTTLYYDSRRNLLARGVLCEPRPFPGFVPDPPGVTLFAHGGHG